MRCALRDGSELDLSQHSGLAWHVGNERCHMQEIIRQLRDGLYNTVSASIRGRVLDLGANCGMFSAWASPHCDEIIAVEPSTRHFTAMKQFLGSAGIRNVRCVNAALWTRDGTIGILLDDSNPTMDRINYHGKRQSQEKVPCYRLDTLLEQFRFYDVDFCKMDIEGAEEDVINGDGFEYAAQEIRCLWCECHNYKDWGDGWALAQRVAKTLEKHFPVVRLENIGLVVASR